VNPKPASSLVGQAVGQKVLAELIRRAREIDGAYRDVAQRMGQLYVYADENGLASMTRNLDELMRNASENERLMAAILDELLVASGRRQQRKQ
jgi:hypothetical protein